MAKRKRVMRMPPHPEQREWEDISEKSGFDVVVILGNEGDKIGFMPVSKRGKNWVKNMVHAPKHQWKGRAFYWPYQKGLQLFHMVYFLLPLTVGLVDESDDKRWTEEVPRENPRRRRNRWPPERMPAPKKKQRKPDFDVIRHIYADPKGRPWATFIALTKKGESFFTRNPIGKTIPCARNDDGKLEANVVGIKETETLYRVLLLTGYNVRKRKAA